MGINEIRNIKAGLHKKEKNKFSRIDPKSKKKIAQEQAEKENGTDAAMDKWFEDRGEELTGICLFCGGKTCKAKPKSFYATEELYEKAIMLQRFSIAHLFAKRKNMFPSIATHPENYIELCFYDNSCHANFDNNVIELEDVKYQHPEAWFGIVKKFLILYPVMTKEEKNRVPEILLSELKNQS